MFSSGSGIAKFCVFAAVFIAAVWSINGITPNSERSLHSRTQAERTQEGTKNSQQHCDNPTATHDCINRLADDVKRRKSQEEKPERGSWKWWTDSPQTIFNFFTMIFTLFAAWGAIGAAKAGRDAATETGRAARATEIAASAAQESAALTKRMIEDSAESHIRLERAYIVDKVPIPAILKAGIEANVVVLNAGKTYGTVRRLVCKWVQFPSGEPPPGKPRYQSFPECFPYLPIVETPVRIGFDRIEISEFDPACELFFMGYFEYTDIFRRLRYTRFCWHWHVNQDGASFQRAGSEAYNNTCDDPPERPN